MSDEVLIAIITAVTSTIGVGLGVLAQLKLGHIKALTNSNYSKLSSELERSQKTVAKLAKPRKTKP